MTSFGWLHLTDLHWGSSLGNPVFKTVEAETFDDLEYVHELSGPWDVVFFTGDLVQTGSQAEFDDLEDSVLARLRAHLARLGSPNAHLLAVPGNHDLVRPSRLPTGLSHYANDLAVQQGVFEPQGEFLPLIERAFEPYKAWWGKQPVTRVPGFRTGLFPGDFSVRLEAEGVRVGVVGLNTAALHLSDGSEGRLAATLRQFSTVCPDPLDWKRDTDVRVILTHHPVAWLASADQRAFLEEIAPASLFHLHLHGHMHESDSSITRRRGASPRHTIQGASFCGLERVGGELNRVFGYAAGRFHVDRDKAATEVWPRQMHRVDGSGYVMRADHRYELERRTSSYSHPQGLCPRLSAPVASGLRRVTWFSELDWRALFAHARVVRTLGISSSSLYASSHVAIVKDFLRRPETRLSVTIADPDMPELMRDYEALFEEAPGTRAQSIRKSVQTLTQIAREVRAIDRLTFRCIQHMTRYACFAFDDAGFVMVPYRNRPRIDPGATLALHFIGGDVVEKLLKPELNYVETTSKPYVG